MTHVSITMRSIVIYENDFFFFGKERPLKLQIIKYLHDSLSGGHSDFKIPFKEFTMISFG
jgi:hypothetical protein